MRRRNRSRVAAACSAYGLLIGTVLLFGLSCSAPASVPAQSPGSRLADEIGRLDTLAAELEKAELPASLKGIPKPAATSLDRPKAASSDLVRLYRLRDPFISFETFAFVAANAGAAADLESFERLWNSSEARFAAPRSAGGTNSLLEGLEQAAGNRAERLYRASVAYAKIDSPSSGLYYLAEAIGNQKFREFVASLDLPDAEAGGKIDREAVSLALDSMEAETLKEFGGDPGANSMIPVSVRLKEARELFDAGSLEGAALLLIESRLALSMRTRAEDAAAPSPAANPPARSDGIHSLLVALLESEGPPLSTLVRNDLIPLYDSLAVDRELATAAPASTTVTLVRWPYT